MNADRTRPSQLSLVAAVLGLALAWTLSPRPAFAGGFAEPVPVLPEIGLWADGFTELGYGREPGLVILWGLDAATASGSDRPTFIDWARVPFSTHVQVFDSNGKRVASEERFVDPPRLEDGVMSGGFPVAVHVLLRNKGEYRVRLEAYPLIDAAAAGLDSVPRRAVEVSAALTRVAPEQSSWQVSDLLVLHDMASWRPGTPADRTWYEWAFDPAVSRLLTADSSGAYLAFEIQRGRELVAQCQRSNCRVSVTIYDSSGGVASQTLRPVPNAFAVSAYVVPIDTIALEPGEYEARVEVYEGGEKLAGERRAFRVRRGSQPARPSSSESEEAVPTASP